MVIALVVDSFQEVALPRAMAEYLLHQREDRFLGEGDAQDARLVRIVWLPERRGGEVGGAMACEVVESALVVALVRFVEALIFADGEAPQPGFDQLSRWVMEWLACARLPGEYARVVACHTDG